MEMKIGGETIKLKKDYLSIDEVEASVGAAISAAVEKGDFDFYGFSPMSMKVSFYASLFYYCIEDFDIESSEDFNKYYNLGVQTELLKAIKNAQDAYDMMQSIYADMTNIQGILLNGIDRFINILEEKLPKEKELKKILNKLPKDWAKVSSEYNDIIGKTPKKEDE